MHDDFQLASCINVALCYAISQAQLMTIFSCDGSVFSFTDGGFSKSHMFPFTPHSGRSCDSVSLSLSSIRDPFTDTVFSAAIAPLNQPPFDLGTLSTASLIVRALKGESKTLTNYLNLKQ